MRYLAVIVMGILFGAAAMYLNSAFSKEYVTVRILDNGECSPIRYSILTNGLSVTVSDNQIETDYPAIASKAEAYIHFVPEYNGKKKHSYKVVAEYSDCENIVSEERDVERGRSIYEWIEARKVKHQIRG